MSKTNTEEFLAAAEELAKARIEFANVFLLNKISKSGVPVSDKTAEHMTIAQTRDEITLIKARYDLAKIRIDKEYA